MKTHILHFLAVLTMSALLTSCSSRVVDDTLWEIAVAEDERLLPLDKLDQWIADSDTTIRARSAYAIGIVGQKSSYDRLSKLLTDKKSNVLAAACFAAGQVADTSVQDLLLELSHADNRDVKKAALEALSKLTTDSAAVRLSQTLNDEREDAGVRALCAQWLFRLKDTRSRNALIAQAMSPNDRIREGVFYSLARRSIKEAQSILLLGLSDVVEQIQIYSIAGLTRLSDTGSGAVVVTLLQSESPRVQYHAAKFAEDFKVKSALPFLLPCVATGVNPHLRVAATRALGPIVDNQSALALLNLINDADANVAAAALVAYAGQGRADGGKFAQLFAGDADSRKRIAGAQALGIVKGEAALATLEHMLGDSIPLVRSEAYEQFCGFAPAELAERFTERALNDEDFMPVAIAVNRITAGRMLQYVPRLCELFNSTSVIENKQTVLDALIELADSIADKMPLAAIADFALQHPDFNMRKRGRELGVKVSVPIPAEPDHFTSALTRAKYDEVYGLKTTPRVRLATSGGEIDIELLPQVAPKTVANYLELARKGFYNGKLWHRVVPDFVIQDGCPRGDGWGSPGYEIRCEYNQLPFERGSVGMATSGKDTGGSQYFICHSAQPHLDGRYTVFGRVIKGLEIVDRIQPGDSIRTVTEITTGVGE